MSKFLNHFINWFTLSIEKDPYNGKLLTLDELRDTASKLSEKLKNTTSKKQGINFRSHFKKNAQLVESNYFSLSDFSNKHSNLSSGSEWILDNFHQIEQTIREISRDMPRGYYRALPKILEGNHIGHARVYILAREYLIATDSRVSSESLNLFIREFQKSTPLQLSEVWAFPIMLRLILIEHIRKLSFELLESSLEQDTIEQIANSSLSEAHSNNSATVLNNLSFEVKRSGKKLSDIAPALIRRLRSGGSIASLAIQWIEEEVKNLGEDVARIDLLQKQREASRQISIGHCITSLKTIAQFNWRNWAEDQSTINHILAKDPSGAFSKGDFLTRDKIRRSVESISRRDKVSEISVAETAIALASSEELSTEAPHLYNQVGYYLIDDGIIALEEKLRSEPSLTTLAKGYIKKPELYISAVLLSSCLLSLYLFSHLPITWDTPFFALFSFLSLLVILIQFSSDVFQFALSKLIPATLLPKLELKDSIPDDLRTAVVIQAICSSKEHLNSIISHLEVCALANPLKNVRYGVLVDLPDSDRKLQAGDIGLDSLGRKLVKKLNKKHSDLAFFILFRERAWNPSESKYMGWERKRGKIEEFNELIRGAQDTSFITEHTDLRWLQKVQYVITLDSDTQLPAGTVSSLIGCAAHPLNTPEFNSQTQEIARGYTIIQPRVSISLESSQATWFSKIFAGVAGLDPYTQSISDLYQDAFSDSSYIGKGIYHVDSFRSLLKDKLPENTVLSHDLLESCFVRCGLASDIELYDDYPAHYIAHAKRAHRWIRGDWQISPWLFKKVKNKNGESINNSFPLLSKWKIADNLRRSLQPLAQLIILAAACRSGTCLPWVLTLLIISQPGILFTAYNLFFNIPIGYSISTFFSKQIRELTRVLQRGIFHLIVLPFEVYICCDAIIRTAWRMRVSRKHLLQWQTAFDTSRHLSNSPTDTYKSMSTGTLLCVLYFWIATLYLSVEFSTGLILLTIAWIASPLLASFSSKSPNFFTKDLDEHDRNYLRGIARETWNYFENNLKEKYHYLIPDNIQEVPEEVTAERTSPTNISLSLLAIQSAQDLGFTNCISASELSNKVLTHVASLERYKGHLYNWYDISDKRPLAPRYISSVDSGNFVGHLIAARTGLNELKFQEYISQDFIIDLQHSLSLEESLSNLEAVKLLLKRLEQDDSYDQATLGEKQWCELRKLLDHLSWINHIEVIEELASQGDLPKKLSRFSTILEGRPLTPWLNSRIVSRILNSDLEKRVSTKGKTKEIQELIDKLNRAQEALFSFESTNNDSIATINTLVDETDFSFLFDDEKKLLTIGYNVDIEQADGSSYDLLASEARLASFIGIAKGDLPPEHWFMLGRSLTEAYGDKSLLSWSGTMFEYLMPIIVMKTYPDTLLDRTYESVTRIQQEYASRRHVPWGISESAYGTVDYENTYQYRAFGVPGLGLKRGLLDDLVVSPYSSLLALLVDSHSALKNLSRLEEYGARGKYGFYEAIDFTKERLVEGEQYHVIKSFFAHHQGMSLAAANNVLNADSLVRRFHSDPLVQAFELLLQEKFPDRIPLIVPHQPEQLMIDSKANTKGTAALISVKKAHAGLPKTHLLSNGKYSVFIDHKGNGYSSYENNLSLNRYHQNGYDASYGQFIYLKDEESQRVWSACQSPCDIKGEIFESVFLPHLAEFHYQKQQIRSLTQVTVSPEDNLEIRSIKLKNLSRKNRRISATSFFEVSLASFGADIAHPAFSKLFIHSEWNKELEALFFTRKPRSSSDTDLILFHFISTDVVWAPTEFTTDRASFLGRGRTPAFPREIIDHESLSSKQGFVLDPCASVKNIIEISPNEEASLSFVTGIAQNMDEAKALIRKYREKHQVQNTFNLAWSYASVELKNQKYSQGLSDCFHDLCKRLLFNLPKGRTSVSPFDELLPQDSLWRLGISGDKPIVLAEISDNKHTQLFHDLLLCHEFLRSRGVEFDLVILNDKADGYLQELQNELEAVLRSSLSSHLLNQGGGIFLVNASNIGKDERTLLEWISRVYVNGERGSLSEQLSSSAQEETPIELPYQRTKFQAQYSTPPLLPNGAFSDSSNAYTFKTNLHKKPPVPWSNVIANDHGGFVVTESGGGFTWFNNSREYRLSPWSNDPVSDPLGEAIFIRDCSTSEYWSPTAAPLPSSDDVHVEHSFGYSRFSKSYSDTTSKLELTMMDDKPCKVWTLEIENDASVDRTFEILFYIDLVLGVNKESAYRHIRTGIDRPGNFLFARNDWNREFKGQVVFIGSDLPLQDYTCDKTSFLGIGGSITMPAFLENLKRERQFELKTMGKDALKKLFRSGSLLSQQTNNCLEPAAILKYEVQLKPGKSQKIRFYAACASSLKEAQSEAKIFTTGKYIAEASKKSVAGVEDLVSSVSVQTPSSSFNQIMNGWLLYQTTSCRMKARSGFFQSSGAFGFRDQLQDSLAFLSTHPEITREQILIHAGRQFLEGDVQHWWHPPSGRGIRSQISDNYMWLPYSVSRYIDRTGEYTLLDEDVEYLHGPLLEPDQHDLYFVPESSGTSENLYDHCMRAIHRSIDKVGPRGLPLIGAGDWNDGMNEVGTKGKGESVWLAWFFAHIYKEFSAICTKRGDKDEAKLLKKKSKELVDRIDEHAWDGAWYRRAYFDDGTPLGASERKECRIDSLAQSWSVITGLGKKRRRKEAIQSAYEHLFDKENQLVRLLWPPLQHEQPSAGYIQSYPPGIRENGGQYTHGSSWLIAALAADGMNDEAFELFSAMNPVNHGGDLTETYQCEPYVTCGDVYSHEDHAGRGGWSWYTGSSGWLHQVGLNYILGIHINHEGIRVAPQVPTQWQEFTTTLKIEDLTIEIQAHRGKEHSMQLGKKKFEDFVPWSAFTDSNMTIKVVF